jgi:acetyltransferase-like isoleucine patch superfamily enzyme
MTIHPSDSPPRVAEELDLFNAALMESPERATELASRIFGRIGEGVCIEPPLVVHGGSNVEAGDRLLIGADCTLRADERIEIGNDVILGPRVKIGGMENVATGPIRIGDGAWLGADVVVHPGVTIGPGALVMPHGVVTRNLPANALAAGNPCRVQRIMELGAGCGPRTFASLAKLGAKTRSRIAISPPLRIEVGTNIDFGDAVVIRPGCEIHDYDRVMLGDGAVIGPNVKIYAGHCPDLYCHCESGDQSVTIGAGARIGAGAVIYPGTRVRAGTIVPNGAVLRPPET